VPTPDASQGSPTRQERPASSDAGQGQDDRTAGTKVGDPGLDRDSTIVGNCTSHARGMVIPQKEAERLSVDPRAGVKTSIFQAWATKFPAWATKARRVESLARPQSQNETPLVGGTFALGISRRAPHSATARGLGWATATSHEVIGMMRVEGPIRGSGFSIRPILTACIHLGVDRESAFAGVCRPLPVRSRSAAPGRGGAMCH